MLFNGLCAQAWSCASSLPSSTVCLSNLERVMSWGSPGDAMPLLNGTPPLHADDDACTPEARRSAAGNMGLLAFIAGIGGFLFG